MGIPNSVDLSDLANSQQSLEEMEETKELSAEIPKVDVVVDGAVVEPDPT